MRLGTWYRYLVMQRLDLSSARGKVLDIGCYDGFFLSTLDAEEKTGIDLSPCPVYPGIKYINGDFLKYDFKTSDFDCIYAFDVLEHVSDDSSFIKKMLFLLKPQGKAVISVPGKNISIFPSPAQPWVDRRWDHIYRRGYDQQGLQALVEAAGPGFDLRLVCWEGLCFRRFYILLSLLWRICRPLAKIILKIMVGRETTEYNGDQGFLFAVISAKQKGEK